MSFFRGFDFPFQKGPLAFPQPAIDDALIKASLVQLILTGKNERVMRPAVGSSAYSYIFEANDSSLDFLIQNDIAQVISTFEPRVSLISVAVSNSDVTDPSGTASTSTVTVTINYVVLPTQQLAQLELSFAAGAP
jgi:phage baseplate assembly protein W